MNKDFYTNVQVSRGKVLYRGVAFDEHGDAMRVSYQIPYEPTVWIKSPQNKPSLWKDIHGKYLMEKTPGNIYKTKKFIDTYADVEGFDVYGNFRFEYGFIYDEYKDGVNFDANHINVWNIDIEVGSENGFPDPEDANETITAISIVVNADKIYVLGYDEYNTMPDGYKTDNPRVMYIACESETVLIRKFLDMWEAGDIDIVTGWNVKKFDMVYLYNRIRKLWGEDQANRLSPWNNVWFTTERNQFGNDETILNIVGLAQIDLLEIYKKYAPKGKSQESYTLDHIAYSECGEKKLDYSEVESLHALYKTNFQKYIDYNIRDTHLVELIDGKLKLIELCLTLAYSSLTNYEDVFRQVRMWDIIITNHLMRKNIIVSPIKKHDKDERYQGAFVKEPQTGMWDWVASGDLDSLYPHLIMQYNISPDTFIPQENWNEDMRNFIAKNRIEPDTLLNRDIDLTWLKDYDITITPNGQFFSVGEEGFLPEIMREMYDDRKKFKKQMIEEKKKLELIVAEKKRRELE